MIVAAVTVRSEPPVFFNVSVWFDELPTNTLPKAKLVGFVAKSPAETAVAESAIFAVPLSVLTATLPLALPALLGAKIMLTVALCPTPKVNGRVNPLMLKPTPVTVACATVILDPPVLVRVTVLV